MLGCCVWVGGWYLVLCTYVSVMCSAVCVWWRWYEVQKPVVTFRLRNVDKEYLQQIMDRAVLTVKMRDRKNKCCEYACRAILADRNMLQIATARLSEASEISKN